MLLPSFAKHAVRVMSLLAVLVTTLMPATTSTVAPTPISRGGGPAIEWLVVPPNPSHGDSFYFRYGIHGGGPPGFQFYGWVNGLALPDSLVGISDSTGAADMTLLISDPTHHLIVGLMNTIEIRAPGYRPAYYEWLILHPSSVSEEVTTRRSIEAAAKPELIVYPSPCFGVAWFRLTDTTARQLEFRVLDSSGREVRRALNARRTPTGDLLGKWDTRDEHGRRVATGIYFFEVDSPLGRVSRSIPVLR